MPKENGKLISVDNIRHSEYYGLQETFDRLYAQSKNGEIFTNLMEIILSRENILLAYRNIKANAGSNTPGTDRQTIRDIGILTPEEVVDKVRFIVAGSPHGYRPKPVRRKDIPKPYDPTKTRPLGIPCIWDRLIQQCIKQVMEPICEAKFSNNSFGFRPNRSVEHAIAKTYRLLNLSHLHYVVEFDVKGFFDNVNHPKLVRQIWSMGIRDKHLIYIIRCILKAPIRMPDGSIVHPRQGTPQGGIISPLLANIVLNELDHWVESQWQANPVTRKYRVSINRNGSECLHHGYRAMRNTELKEMFIVRYADDFRVFCRTKTDAERAKHAVTQWLSDRLKLEVSPEKTKVVNVKRRYSDFLGFKIKVIKKAGKEVVKSHISDKQLSRKRQNLLEQAKRIARPRPGKTEFDEVNLYNFMVMGMQNYYRIATDVSCDCNSLNRSVMTILTNRLKTPSGNRLVKTGRKLTDFEKTVYGKARTMRYVAGTGEPIYPISYVQHRKPMSKKLSVNSYSPDGRQGLHDNLRINTSMMLMLMRQPLHNRSVEYADNRISLYSAQWGKCAITGRKFRSVVEIHCHHATPRSKDGTDKYENLVLILEPVHRLIHATRPETIEYYKQICNLNSSQMKKLNEFRRKVGLESIS